MNTSPSPDLGKVILVDQQDREIGEMEKLEAHQKGVLHRAFSVFIFNSKGEMMIHQRALNKYHSPGLWTNACCSHPAPGETLNEAVKRRLKEELGMSASAEHLFHFVYKADFENGLTEHELDHVFLAITDDNPNPNPAEVDSIRYIEPDTLLEEIKQSPDQFTFWFKEVVERVIGMHAAAQ